MEPLYGKSLDDVKLVEETIYLVRLKTTQRTTMVQYNKVLGRAS